MMDGAAWKKSSLRETLYADDLLITAKSKEFLYPFLKAELFKGKVKTEVRGFI